MTSQGLVLLFEVGTWPPHDGFTRMGRFNLCSILADDGRKGLRLLRTHLTRRPREDTFLPEHKLVELRISAAGELRIGAVGGSCGLRYDRGRTVAPAELGAVNPHAMEDHSEAPGDGDNGAPHAAPLGHPHAPRLQP
jgi:hypothetical protein